MNKKRIVGVTLAVGACGVLAAAGMMLSKKSGAVVLDQAGNDCVEKAEEIPKMLEQVKENTSALGWKIVDRPQVTLSHENLEIIEDMRRRMDE